MEMEYDYSERIAAAIDSFLQNSVGRYQFCRERGFFMFHVEIGDYIDSAEYEFHVKDTCVLVYLLCPLGAAHNDRRAMAEMADFVCRVNYGLIFGCMELDMSDGMLRLRMCLDCSEQELPSNEMIQNALQTEASLLRYYERGIVEVAMLGVRGKDAFEHCNE